MRTPQFKNIEMYRDFIKHSKTIEDILSKENNEELLKQFFQSFAEK